MEKVIKTTKMILYAILAIGIIVFMVLIIKTGISSGIPTTIKLGGKILFWVFLIALIIALISGLFLGLQWLSSKLFKGNSDNKENPVLKFFGSLGTSIGGIFSSKLFRPVGLLLILWLCFVIYNHMDHKGSYSENNKNSYIPKKGIFGLLSHLGFGKKDGAEKADGNSSNSYQQPATANPTVQYRQDAKTERDRLYYENEQKRWDYQLKMKELENQNDDNGNKPLKSSDMTPNSSFQTSQHPDNGWGGETTQQNNPGSTIKMSQLDGFQKPQ
jgi:hypothetical protein